VQARDAGRTRLGLLVLALYGVLIAAMIVARGPFIDPSESPEPFARVAGSAGFLAYSLGTTVGVLLGLYGFLALYAALAGRGPKVAGPAFRGLVLSMGLVLLMPILGVYAFAGPPIAALYTRDPQHAVALASAMSNGGYLPMVLLQALFYCAGSLFFGIALWRSGAFPRWTGLFFALQGPLIQFVPLVSFAGEIVGGLMLAASCAGIALVGWRRLGEEAA
jgi:hypothetical protein